MRIRRANRFCEHILHTRRGHHSAHCAAGDHASAFGGGLQQNFARAIAAEDKVRNAGLGQVDLDQIFLRRLNPFANGLRNFLGFSRSVTDNRGGRVAHNHQRGEGKVLAALDDLGDAVDGDDLIFQLKRI